MNLINHMQQAERITYQMDLQEQFAGSIGQVDEEETTLVSMRMDAERMLSNMKSEKVNIDSSKRRIEQNLHQMYRRDVDENSKSYRYYIAAVKSLEKTQANLSEALRNIAEAIDYLEEYLYPSETQTASAEDVPFESSVWGVIAQSTAPATSKTPQEAAMKLVKDILKSSNLPIAQDWQEAQGDPRTAYSIHDGSAYYDLLFMFGSEDFASNPVGEKELDRACQADEMQKYIAEIMESIVFELS